MAEVCLILEGTYPFVTGGVSSCVYQLINRTPHLNYSIFYIGSVPEDAEEFKYPVPANVQLIKKVFLFDYELKGDPLHLSHKIDINLLQRFHARMGRGSEYDFADLYHSFFDNPDIPEPMKILQSKTAWDFLYDVYRRRFAYEDAPSFIDFFYTWRFTHVPLFKILSAELPRAKIYHAFCTGYAGLAGAVAKLRFNRPFLLSEHGIYSNEREIEISMADWIHQGPVEFRATENSSVFKKWWINLFLFMGRVSYLYSDEITTLFQGNRQKQIEYGADAAKISIIPNGIDYEKFAGIEKEKQNKKIVGLVGRVVPIKDIKTFIKAAGVVAQKLPDVEFWIMGPADEDEDYLKDCIQLTRILGLDEKVLFKGKVNMTEYYGKLDLLALSSISEGQPLVLLEAFSAGVPAVTTDVGACRELIYGMGNQDRELGAAGRVTPLGQAEQLANAMIELLSDDQKRIKMGEVGRRRVGRFYREDENIFKYNKLYMKYLKSRFR